MTGREATVHTPCNGKNSPPDCTLNRDHDGPCKSGRETTAGCPACGWVSGHKPDCPSLWTGRKSSLDHHCGGDHDRCHRKDEDREATPDRVPAPTTGATQTAWFCGCPGCAIPDSPNARLTGWCGYCGDHCRTKKGPQHA